MSAKISHLDVVTSRLSNPERKLMRMLSWCAAPVASLLLLISLPLAMLFGFFSWIGICFFSRLANEHPLVLSVSVKPLDQETEG